MFSVDLGGRTSAPNIALIVTDGVSTIDSEKTIPYAKEAKVDVLVREYISIPLWGIVPFFVLE